MTRRHYSFSLIVPQSSHLSRYDSGLSNPNFIMGTHCALKNIIYTGTMWYEPNVDAVRYFSEEILPLLKVEIPDIEFIIVGDNPTEEVMPLSEKSGISITGHVDDIRPYLSNASVFVAPIRMGSGTRLKILSAMSMGIPVVSTKIGCEGIEVKDGENICIADNPNEFRDRIIRLFRDSNFRDRITREARELINKKYSRSVLVRELSNFWGQIESEIKKNV